MSLYPFSPWAKLLHALLQDIPLNRTSMILLRNLLEVVAILNPEMLNFNLTENLDPISYRGRSQKFGRKFSRREFDEFEFRQKFDFPIKKFEKSSLWISGRFYRDFRQVQS